MSTVPFCTSGIRLAEVTSVYLTSIFLPMVLPMSSMMRWQSSTWKPTYLPPPSVYDSAPDEPRTPMTTAPVALIFLSVSVVWACAATAAAGRVAAKRDFFMGAPDFFERERRVQVRWRRAKRENVAGLAAD